MEPTAERVFDSRSDLCLFDPTLPPDGSGGWESIVREHEGAMRSRIWSLLGRLGLRPGRELVEEIVQEAYCRLFSEALRRWRGRTLRELLAYMGVIAERAVLDHFRGTQAGKRSGREVRLGRQVEKIADPRNPERDLLHAEAEAVLVRRCGELSARRESRRSAWVARLAFLEGCTNQEIAGAAGGRLSPGHVACLVHRLRRRLAENGFPPGTRRQPAGSRRRGRRRCAL
jgi:RNA polymerase sigma factor (sigma-70 family)